MSGAILRIAIACLLAACAWAQADKHAIDDSARPLCERSAFAHGYMHGYEDGFHQADLDIHLARRQRPFADMKPYRNASASYEPGFGDKNFYQHGYRAGFQQGYEDAQSGSAFRGLQQVRDAAAGPFPEGMPSSKEFDIAFAHGYEAGRVQGTYARPVSSICPVAERGEAFCDAYARGFRMGLSDGSATRGIQETQTAQK